MESRKGKRGKKEIHINVVFVVNWDFQGSVLEIVLK